MKKILYLLLLQILLISCTQNSFEEILFRTTDDPFDDVPETDSTSLEHTVFLSWKEDDACDLFRLMRSYDQTTLSFSCIYEGKNTHFIDTSLINDNCYIYRLDKIRGDICFEGNHFAYGYSSDCRKDDKECNDIESMATYLEYDMICNLPCVRYCTNNYESVDNDWFYIEIPPRRSADIIISQHNLQNSSQGATTNLKIQVKGSESVSVTQMTANRISNTSYETKRFYFNIFPETTGLLSSGSCNTVIEYTVSLNQIINYTL